MYISIKCRFLKSECFSSLVFAFHNIYVLSRGDLVRYLVPGYFLISALQILKHSCVIIKDFSIHFAGQEIFENVGSKSLSTNL